MLLLFCTIKFEESDIMFKSSEIRKSMFTLHTNYRRMLKAFDRRLDEVCRILVRDKLDPHQRDLYDDLASHIITEKTSLMKQHNNLKESWKR